MKRGRPSLYRKEFCEQVVELMSQGRSLDGCAAFLHVHPDSLYQWQHIHREFSDAVQRGRAAAIAFWESRLLDVAQGGPGHAGAIQWALRNRSRAASGWDHAHARVEVAGPNGGAIPLQAAVVTIDAHQLSAEQRQVLRQALIAARDNFLDNVHCVCKTDPVSEATLQIRSLSHQN